MPPSTSCHSYSRISGFSRLFTTSGGNVNIFFVKAYYFSGSNIAVLRVEEELDVDL
jgi:hypothetical protein